MDTGRPAASNMAATAPATCGDAIEVPERGNIKPSWRGASRGMDRAAITSTPGASNSGLSRRSSRVGPQLLNGAIGVSGTFASYAPTVITNGEVAIVPSVYKCDVIAGANRDCAPGRGRLLSIHAW